MLFSQQFFLLSTNRTDKQMFINHWELLNSSSWLNLFSCRECSLNQQDTSPQPCFAISTLFLRSPSSTSSTYLVYHLILLPTVVNNNRYMYSNLPKAISVNSTYKTLILWNDDFNINECLFLIVIQCPVTPLSIPLANSPCLSHLFSGKKSSNPFYIVTQSNSVLLKLTMAFDYYTT